MRYFKKNNFCFQLLLLFVIQFCFSQKAITKNYSVIDGLPSNAIYSVFIDSRNIIWAGTDKGISKVENGSTTNYYESDGIAYNNCWAIVEDSNNNLWFGSYGGGVTYYDGNTFKIINNTNGLINDRVRKLFVYKDKLYVGTKKGVSIINTSTKKIQNLQTAKDLELQIMGFFEYNNTVYIQSYKNGVWKHNTNENNLSLITDKHSSVFSVLKHKDSILVSFDGYYQKNKAIKTFHINDYLSNKSPAKAFGNSVVWDYNIDKNNNIYAVADGINYPTGGVFKIEQNRVKNENSNFNINSTKCWSIAYNTNNELLYIGTLDQGLFEVKLDNKVLFNEDITNIIDVKIQNEHTYFLTQEGLKIKASDDTIDITKHDFFKKISEFKKKLNLASEDRFNNTRLSDLEFKNIKLFNDTVWISTTIGIFSMNIKTNTLEFHHIITNGFILFNDNSGYFQYPYRNLVYINNIYDALTLKKSIKKFIINAPSDVNSIIKIDNELYFLSQFIGLYKLKNGVFTSFKDKGIWSEKELILATVSPKNNLVIANTKGEVFIIDVKNGFRVITKICRDQLHGNSIKFLKTYKDYIIIGTEKGINFYRSNKIKIINKAHGIKSEYLTSAALDKDNLIVGSEKGYYRLDLNKILKTTTPNYNINITDIQANYESIASKNFHWYTYQDKMVVLPYQKNNLSISFKVNNHPYAENLEYRYKIEGLDSDKWSQWSTKKQLNFSYLASGIYPILIEVRDHNNAEIYCKKIITLHIKPPFWKTWWFISISILLILGALYVKYKLSIKKIKKQEALKTKLNKRIAETKLEALQSQMNPHFTFNAMNSIQNYVIDNDIDKALMYIGKFSKLMRKTLDNSSETRITLQEEIDYINTYVTIENMRFEDAIKVEINHKDLDTFDEYIPPMLIQPLIENSFHHAFNIAHHPYKLTITFSKENDFLKCEVKDNGTSIKKTTQIPHHTPKAIGIIKERLSLISNVPIHKLITITSTDKGTITTLFIPFDN
ncbi:sensor histidine kinase [Winogradskyella helgolandensis]|uniref:sensor histidine kinase n=1 Tax=Winogradskyella helgolandensis TaxID=2697010 RepID=UPI0015CBBA90|nr:histidine kinase [Winogradskyella helgolandensis]